MTAIEKRFQVFVSSTFQDLADARQEVMQALLELDCMPAGMELFPAADDDQWTLIKKVIDDCDYYIVVIGGRYGSLGPGGSSFTQMEYEYAIQQNKPVIAFLHKDPDTLPAGDVEKGEDGRKKLEAFRTLAQKKMCKYWTTSSDLGSVVSRSLIKLMRSNPAIGWVRADALPEQSATDEILRLRRLIEDLQAKLEKSNSATAVKLENLAQGDDVTNVVFEFDAYEPGKHIRKDHYEWNVDVSWNQLFAAISPDLIDEAPDRTILTALNGCVVDLRWDSLMRRAAFKDLELKNFKVDATGFDTIKVQFLALGLITKSTKRRSRSVGDKATYWTLTPAGEELMMMLRAIRRDDLPSKESIESPVPAAKDE